MTFIPLKTTYSWYKKTYTRGDVYDKAAITLLDDDRTEMAGISDFASSQVTVLVVVEGQAWHDNQWEYPAVNHP